MKSERSNNQNKSKSTTESGSESRGTTPTNKWRHTMLHLKPWYRFQLEHIPRIPQSYTVNAPISRDSLFWGLLWQRFGPGACWPETESCPSAAFSEFDRKAVDICMPMIWSNRMAGLGWTHLVLKPASTSNYPLRWFKFKFKPPEFWEHLIWI